MTMYANDRDAHPLWCETCRHEPCQCPKEGPEDWRSWDPKGFWCHCGNPETIETVTHGHSASGICRCGGVTSVG